MVIRRAAEHPDWCYWATRHDADDVIDTAYDGMLERLGLSKPAYGSAEDVRRWMRESNAIECLKFYALRGHADAFHATYQELKRYQESSAAQEVRAFIDELTRDKLPEPRPVFVPIDIVRCKDDSELDGADDLTRWLERQFGGTK